MKNDMKVRHEFVEFMPDQLKDGVIYVSMPLATVVHKCCCGCGMEVVTPLSPTDWRLVFDGDTISLEPSIGNWDYACRSHYWIKHNKIKWAGQWSQEQIAKAKIQERAAKERYYGTSDILVGHLSRT